MKIWKLQFQHTIHGWCIDYYASKRAAQCAFSEAKRNSDELQGYASDPIFTLCEFPNTKAALLHFLNTQTPRHDNG